MVLIIIKNIAKGDCVCSCILQPGDSAPFGVQVVRCINIYFVCHNSYQGLSLSLSSLSLLSISTLPFQSCEYSSLMFSVIGYKDVVCFPLLSVLYPDKIINIALSLFSFYFHILGENPMKEGVWKFERRESTDDRQVQAGLQWPLIDVPCS